VSEADHGQCRRTRRTARSRGAASWLSKVFELNPAGLNWPRAVMILDVALVPLVVFWAIGHEEYLLSAVFGLLFAALADPGGGYRYRASHIAVFGLIGAAVTALGFGIGGDAWGWLVLAAFAVTLAAGLAAMFGVHRFVAAYLLNVWFIVVLGGRVQFPSSRPHHELHLGSGARLGRGGGALDRGDLLCVADPWARGPAPAGCGVAR
jgi:hypothetical protein